MVISVRLAPDPKRLPRYALDEQPPSFRTRRLVLNAAKPNVAEPLGFLRQPNLLAIAADSSSLICDRAAG